MRLRVARFFQSLTTPLLVVGTLGAVVTVLGRMAVFPLPLALTLLAAALLAAVAFAIRDSRVATADLRREALSRLDAAHHLRDRLAASLEGAVAWPPVPAELSPPVRWRWDRLLAPPLAVGAVLALAFLLPVTPVNRGTITPAGELPPVFAEAQQLLEDLRQADAVAPATLDQLQETLEELAARESDGLYSHGTLEAVTHLRDQTAAGAAQLAAALEAGEAAMNQLADTADPSKQESANGSLDAALRELENSSLPANPALAGGFRHGTTSQQADPRKLAEAARRLRQAAGRNGSGTVATQMKFGQRGGTPSQREGWQPPSWLPQEGAGGTSRGPGHPPLALSSIAAEGRDGRDAALESSAADEAALGEMISESAGAPRTDPRREAATEAAGAMLEGAGRTDAARVDELSPAERRAVRRFFQ